MTVAALGVPSDHHASGEECYVPQEDQTHSEACSKHSILSTLLLANFLWKIYQIKVIKIHYVIKKLRTYLFQIFNLCFVSWQIHILVVLKLIFKSIISCEN